MVGEIRCFPEGGSPGALQGMPADQIADAIRLLVESVSAGAPIEAVGVGFPGIIRNGIVEDSPNLRQVKGFALRASLTGLLGGIAVQTLNDADAFAAGVAATRGMLDTLVRVWTLGSGVGFGRYPNVPGIWEGGHLVVSLDPRERYCGCGGEGHLEGLVGDRAMRQRFLDLEPEEVFAGARDGDARCATFVKTWHRALAAATANSIHLEGPGRFFFSGPNARFVDVDLVDFYLHAMVQMSPLQGSSLELLPTSDEVAIIGAAVSALQAAHVPRPSPNARRG
jgi:predicted NBD/HSP70 family sugar kinase